MSQADPFAAYRVGETPDPFAAYRVTTPAAAPPLSREQLMRMSPRELRASGIAPKDLVALMGMRESERTNRGVKLLPVVGGIVGGMAGGVGPPGGGGRAKPIASSVDAPPDKSRQPRPARRQSIS